MKRCQEKKMPREADVKEPRYLVTCIKGQRCNEKEISKARGAKRKRCEVNDMSPGRDVKERRR